MKTFLTLDAMDASLDRELRREIELRREVDLREEKTPTTLEILKRLIEKINDSFEIGDLEGDEYIAALEDAVPALREEVPALPDQKPNSIRYEVSERGARAKRAVDTFLANRRSLISWQEVLDFAVTYKGARVTDETGAPRILR